MNYATPRKNEIRVVVSRSNGLSVYARALSRMRGVFATGPCGVGKSTYACAGLVRETEGRVLILTPDASSCERLSRAVNSACQGIRTRKRPVVKSSVEVLRKYGASIFDAYQVVVVDDVHVSEPSHAVMLALTRDQSERYVLITATPVGKSEDGLGHVNVRKVKDAGVRGMLEPVDGTKYDPSQWPSVVEKVVVFPIDQEQAGRTERYYRKRGITCRKIAEGQTSLGKGVSMLMPGGHHGATFEADMLIDGGVALKPRLEYGVVVERVAEISRCEQVQRWCRVGRTSMRSVVVHGGECRDEVRRDYLHGTLEVMLAAQRFRNTEAVVREYGGYFRSYSNEVATRAVKGADPLSYYHNMMVTGISKVNFVGAEANVVSSMLPMHRNVPLSQVITVIASNGEMPFDKAVRVYCAEPARYRQAILHLVFGRESSYQKVRRDFRERVTVNLRGYFDVTTSDVAYMRRLVRKRDRGTRRKYFVPVLGQANAMYDKDDYVSGKPQTSFSRAVLTLSRMHIVRMEKRPEYKNRALRNLLCGGGVDSKAVVGGRITSRLTRWCKSSGMHVVLYVTGPGERRPQMTEWSQLDTHVARRAKHCKAALIGDVLLVHVIPKRDTGDVCEYGARSFSFDLVGFDVFAPCHIQPEALQDATISYIDYTKVKQERYVMVHLDSLPSLKPAKFIKPSAKVVTGKPTTMQRLVQWHSKYGHTVVLCHKGEEKMETGYQDFKSLRLATDRFNRTRRMAVLTSCALLVFIEEDDEGDILIGGERYTMSRMDVYALKGVPEPVPVLIQAHFDDGNTYSVEALEAEDVVLGNLTHRTKLTELKPEARREIYGCAYFSSTQTRVYLSQGRNAGLHGGGTSSESSLGIEGLLADDGTTIAELERLGLLKDPARDFEKRTKEAPPAQKEVVLADTLVGGGDDDLGEAFAIDLTSEDIISAEPEVTAGKFLTQNELDRLHKHVLAKYGSSFYVAVLQYLVDNDASEAIPESDTVKFVDKKAATAEQHKQKEIAWRKVFDRMERQLSQDRFTIRRYARSMGQSFVPLWENAPALAKYRENANNALFSRCHVRGTDALYYCSFMEHLVPPRLLSDVRSFNATRTFESSAKGTATMKTFGVDTVHKGTAQQQVRHHHVGSSSS